LCFNLIHHSSFYAVCWAMERASGLQIVLLQQISEVYFLET